MIAAGAAGCGVSAEFVRPESTRAPLKRGFHTTYRFEYRVKTHGPLGGLFGSRSIEEPRLLYAEEEVSFDENPGAFRDTGAPFDADKREILWRIPNVRKLWGKTLFLTALLTMPPRMVP